MQTLINWTKNPIVVADENGDRITIKPGEGKPVAGDFKNHPWVKKRRLEIYSSEVSESSGDAETDEELEVLRAQFKNIFGKPPHKNAGKAKLRQEIDKWREEQD
ncbi:hypothetical protein N4G41_03765 [Kosakonia sacchari]|uniref:hypothetical protein n=1 Tax=Kosakonia sacchari TaxID=1158459 RepID=UPI002ACE41E7|nr:hypothetical protein [Kosakonia sacchari]MDZ7320746.1 hypothetical protein [Kosakonia sacchari]